MSFLKKIQERIIPIKTSDSTTLLQPNEKTIHEYMNFPVHIELALLHIMKVQKLNRTINQYKSKLKSLGYECEVLIYIDKKEGDHNVVLPSFNAADLERRSLLPHSPRTDRFALKKFDLLINLYTLNCPQLHFISYVSEAKCRVAPFLEHFKHCSDVLIPIEANESLKKIIKKINDTLKLQPYDRKSI